MNGWAGLYVPLPPPHTHSHIPTWEGVDRLVGESFGRGGRVVCGEGVLGGLKGSKLRQCDPKPLNILARAIGARVACMNDL